MGIEGFEARSIEPGWLVRLDSTNDHPRRFFLRLPPEDGFPPAVLFFAFTLRIDIGTIAEEGGIDPKGFFSFTVYGTVAWNVGG